MFDVKVIKSELAGLVGFKQPANPKHAIIDLDNQKSLSGLYMTDNAYVKIEYLIANVDYNRMTAEQFNDVLKNLRETSAVNICSQVFLGDDFIDGNLIYVNTLNKVTEHTLPEGFVGYAIRISDEKTTGLRINKAIFEMTEAGTLDLLVFNSNRRAPIFSKTIEYGEFYHVESIDLALNNVGFYKGTFYIGYISDGTIKSYKRDFNDSNTISSFKNIEVRTASVANHTAPVIFDLNDVREANEYCGLNLDITVVDDYTEFIITNRVLFSRAMYLDCIIACLAIYASSLRSNGDERNAEELYGRIMLEIEGTRPDDNVITIRGLRPQMIYEISQIKEQIDKLRGGFFGRGFMVETQD